ncbi:WD40 repeat-like protein [Suillus weaverae]|nr:WD40 repeat-like protein [Suillus weaverae]
MIPETKIMEHPVPVKHKNSVTMPYRRFKVKNGFGHILHLPGGQRVIGYSWDRSFRVWDLEKGTQVEEWEDKDFGAKAIALSPGGRTVATGSWDGAVKLWNIDTGKVLKTWMGHTEKVWSVCWSSDGGRVLSGSKDGTFRVWDIESGETIIEPIKTGGDVFAVCYSPNGKMIATGGRGLKIWDANTGELLITISQGYFTCLVWTQVGCYHWRMAYPKEIRHSHVDSASKLCQYHFTISQRAHPRKHIIVGQHSATVEPQNQSAHRTTTSPSRQRELRHIFCRWKVPRH